mgnify:CR=1 FL=1
MPVHIDGTMKTVEEIGRVARFLEEVVLTDRAREEIERSRRVVEDMIERGSRVYGVTTGFGKFADVSIPREDLRALQENLVVSHAVGVGEPFSVEEVRAAMFLRANALALGMSGVRTQVVELLAAMLNQGVTPVVPQKGSVGASGDLAPLSHIALVMIGKGEAWFHGERMEGGEALRRAGLQPLVLDAKEGLALTNGVQMTAAVLALTVDQGYTLARSADVIASLTGQALSIIPQAFDPGIVDLRPHAGAREVAGNLRALLAGSRLATMPGQVRVQDPYVLRCLPQVHGAVRQALEHVRAVVEIESGSATDNPLVFPDGRVISGGNFHGQPLGIAADYLGLSLCSLGNISERRIFRLMDPVASGLPAFLTRRGGINSGLMMMQYTAASLCSECKVLSHPSSVDSIPTSAGQEDHVSMSTTGARKARDIAWNVATILAIEYIAACQALEFLDKDKLSPSGKVAYGLLRSRVLAVESDREMHDDIETARELVVSGMLVREVEREIGSVR